MFPYLLLGIGFAFAAAVQPGPFQAYLLNQALARGWRPTLPAAFAPLLSDGPVILLVLLVLSRVPRGFAPALSIAGGLFLGYLAWGSFRTWRSYDAVAASDPRSAVRSVLNAVIVNILNPSPYLGWSLVLGPMLLKGWHENPWFGISLVIGFYATMVLSLAATIVVFAQARSLGPRITRLLVGVSAAALAGLSVYELWIGVRGLLR